MDAYLRGALKLDYSASHHLPVILLVTLVSLNSMINPVVYFARMKSFQEHVVRVSKQRISRVLSARPSVVGRISSTTRPVLEATTLGRPRVKSELSRGSVNEGSRTSIRSSGK